MLRRSKGRAEKRPDSSGFGSTRLTWPRPASVDHMVTWPAGSAEEDVPNAAEACDARSVGGDARTDCVRNTDDRAPHAGSST